MVLSLIFWVFAIICNACMDAVLFRFGWSIFKNLDPTWWNPNVSHAVAKTIGGWKFDSWHVFQSSMICFLVLSVIFYHKLQWHPKIKPWMQFLIYGLIWTGLKPLTYGIIAPRP